MKLAKKELRKAVNDRLVYWKNQIDTALWYEGFVIEIGARVLIDRMDLSHPHAFNPGLAVAYYRVDYHLGMARAWVKSAKREYKKALELSRLSDSEIVKNIRTQAGR